MHYLYWICTIPHPYVYIYVYICVYIYICMAVRWFLPPGICDAFLEDMVLGSFTEAVRARSKRLLTRVSSRHSSGNTMDPPHLLPPARDGLLFAKRWWTKSCSEQGPRKLMWSILALLYRTLLSSASFSLFSLDSLSLSLCTLSLARSLARSLSLSPSFSGGRGSPLGLRCRFRFRF